MRNTATRILLSMFSLLPALSFCSCSEDQPQQIDPLKTKTYDASNGLKLYYNGQEMPCKSVTLTQDGDRGTAVLFSEFDMSQLAAIGGHGNVPGPGVLPGSPKVTLNFPMSQADGMWNFAGTSETDYCSFSYSGYADADNLKLFINNVKLKTGGITPAVWTPAPIRQENGVYSSLPVYLDWQYDPIPGVDIDLSPYVRALATLPVIPVYNNTAYMSISQALEQVVKTVAFNPDGNIVISYISEVGGAARLAQTYPNRYQYVMVSPTEARLFLDPMSLLGALLVQTSPGTPSDQVVISGNGLYPASGNDKSSSDAAGNSVISSELGREIIATLMKEIVPMLSEGFPVKVSADTKGLSLYVDTEMMIAFVSPVLQKLLADNATVESIISYISSKPEFAPLLPEIEKALQLLPKAFERTNVMRLGVSLVPYTGK